MKKIVSIVLAILVIATVVVIYINGQKTREYNTKSMEISNQLLSCNSDKAVVEAKIEEAWDDYDESLSGDCCFTLFVDSISENLITDAYPAIKKYNFTATAVMDNLQVPGDEGCISRGDYDTLKGAGWDFAIGVMNTDLSGENSADVLEKHIEAHSARLMEAGLELPKTICFGKGQFSEEYIDVVLRQGFKVVRHYEDFDGMFSHAVEKNGLYYLTTANICSNSTSLKKDMSTAYNELYTYSATVRYITSSDREEDKYKDCSKTKYESMLKYITSECPEAQVLNASDLYAYKLNIFNESADFVADFDERIAGLEKELADVNGCIESLMNELAALDK